MPWTDDLDEGTPVYEIAASEQQHVRVVAGPGTGKSFAMKRRVGRLLENGINPSSILPVTFTRIAAEDLHRELVGMAVPDCEDLVGTTLHSLAMKTLMRHHVLTTTGRTPRPLNDFEVKALEADLARMHGGLREVRKKIKAFEAAWARLQRDDPGYVQTEDDAAFERDLLAWLRFHRAMLIGEVIPQLHSYLIGNPAADERREYSHILVDEYQDLNRAEQSVIDLLADNAEVCIVGDDDQSIYSFKHAHPEGIREWIEDKDEASDYNLDECRRCPTTVVEMANALISNNVNRPVPRELIPMVENGEGDVRIIQYVTLDREVAGVIEIIADLIQQGVQPGDILVLAQRGVIGTPIYEGLVERGVPVRSYYAQAELDSEDAQRRFALLKLFVNRQDRVALRWLLGLGSASWLSGNFRHLRAYCENNGAGPWDVLEQLETRNIRIPYTSHLQARFTRIKDELQALDDSCEPNDFRPVIDALFPDGDASVRDIRSLALETIEEVGSEDRVLFLQDLTAAIAKPDVPTEISDVRIMSLHKSKGLSAPVTIIAGCIEGLLPKQPSDNLPQAIQDAQLEEQRRLFYVGISRVKSAPADEKPGTLILTYSQKMPLATAKGAGIDPAQVNYGIAQLLASRFIREMGHTAPDPEAG